MGLIIHKVMKGDHSDGWSQRLKYLGRQRAISKSISWPSVVKKNSARPAWLSGIILACSQVHPHKPPLRNCRWHNSKFLCCGLTQIEQTFSFPIAQLELSFMSMELFFVGVGPLWVSTGCFANIMTNFFPLMIVHTRRQCLNLNKEQPIWVHWGPN